VTGFKWLQVHDWLFTLPSNMGTVRETLFSGWVPQVIVNGIATDLPNCPDADTAKCAVEDYWEAAWEMKP